MNTNNNFFNDDDMIIINALIDNIDNDFVIDDVTTFDVRDDDDNDACNEYCDMLISCM